MDDPTRLVHGIAYDAWEATAGQRLPGVDYELTVDCTEVIKDSDLTLTFTLVPVGIRGKSWDDFYGETADQSEMPANCNCEPLKASKIRAD